MNYKIVTFKVVWKRQYFLFFKTKVTGSEVCDCDPITLPFLHVYFNAFDQIKDQIVYLHLIKNLDFGPYLCSILS